MRQSMRRRDWWGIALGVICVAYLIVLATAVAVAVLSGETSC